MSLRSMAVMRARVEDDRAAGKEPDPAAEQKKLRDQLVALIPAEAISLFVALIGAMAALEIGWRWGALVFVGVLTPAWVLVNYLETADSEQAKGRLPWLEMGVGLAAFAAWSTTVPGGPFDEIGLKTQYGAIIVVGSAGLLTLLVRLKAAWRKRQPSDG